jgi:hydroxylamine dehydrogenase
MIRVGILLCLWIFILQNGIATGADLPISDATAECIECHTSVHPGIVADWQNSRHAKITPQDALKIDGPARKISSKNVPENLKNSVVGCAECHTANPKTHADTFEHNGYDIHVVVSPRDCSRCHAQEAEQYSQNLMANAYDNLAANTLYQKLERSIIGSKKRNKDKIVYEAADPATKAET